MFKSHQMISGESLRWLISVLIMYLKAFSPLLEALPLGLLVSDLATF
ncbi:hypothetical protein [Siminovitchia fordii]|nr:hypothetical protein [Siminovitchia fordii]